MRRPDIERKKPIRNWSAVLGGTEERRSSSEAATPSSAPPPGDDVVSRSVELGYRVVDEYIQRGQVAAERIRSGTYGTEALAEDVQDLAARMARYASDFAGTWLEFLELTRTDGKRPDGTMESQPAGPGAPVPEPPDAAASPLRARVQVITRRRVAVSLDLEPVPSDREIVLHALRGAGEDLPRISDVTWERDDAGGGTIRVRIADEQPSGTYRGAIVDLETNRPVGSLTVTVEAVD